ncbi:hypothetical protein [Rathayibacter sp. AY1C5]|uniref:hypothetical protein n=1 Tax=Rathayibacter sp. AY1C5 TaxID=2080538 RepID=UPI0011B051AA|nr:hypothetical protein [Rathayibacter sp. AY1C5]
MTLRRSATLMSTAVVLALTTGCSSGPAPSGAEAVATPAPTQAEAEALDLSKVEISELIPTNENLEDRFGFSVVSRNSENGGVVVQSRDEVEIPDFGEQVGKCAEALVSRYTNPWVERAGNGFIDSSSGADEDGSVLVEQYASEEDASAAMNDVRITMDECPATSVTGERTYEAVSSSVDGAIGLTSTFEDDLQTFSAVQYGSYIAVANSSVSSTQADQYLVLLMDKIDTALGD